MQDQNTTDPVCGMTVDLATAKHTHTHAGTDFAFCCAGCRTKFIVDPQKYLAPEPSTPADPTATYTCPMHPEILQQGPGACPICGMGLDPLEPSATAAPNHERIDLTRRFRIGLALTLPVLLLDMAGHLGLTPLPPQTATWIQFAFATPVVLWAGAPFLARGWASLRTRNLNMFTLIALGTGTAWLYSLAATLTPASFPAGFHAMGGAVPVYYEAASVITVLVLLGQILELRAREQTGDAIRALLNLAPKTARRLRDNTEDEDIPLDHIAIGDRLRIRPGEAIPADGTLESGQGPVDESMITGESMPVAKTPGASLIAGTINGLASLVMRAQRVGAETVLARIVALVAAAQRSRAPIQRLADTVAGWFVPLVLAAALAAFAAWAVWGPPPALAYALIAAVSVVIIACPCALGLATPMSIAVAIGRGAGAGVLVSAAESLERLEKADTLVIDKTGTLTEGRPDVTAIVPMPGFTEADILRLAAALEQSSEHPLAAAILAAARTARLAPPAITEFVAIPGQGITATLPDGRPAALGNAPLMREAGIDPTPLQPRADSLRQTGATALFLAAGNQLAGLIAVADPIKPAARAALDALREDGLRIVMLTGDDRTTAEAVARSLAITDLHAGALPADKHRIVQELKSRGHIVAMAGDGINDAPALAAADIGIAMGTGADIAIRSAGITLLGGDLEALLRARRLSRATMRNIRQNLVFAFAYNAIGVPIAAGVLYPLFGILLSPIIAALAMSLSSVSVIANALRLRRIRL